MIKNRLPKIKTANTLISGNLGSLWQVVASTLLIFILSQIIAVFIVELFIALLHGPSGSLDNSALAQFFYVLLAEGLAAWSVFYILKRRKAPLSAIGLGRRPQWRDVWRAAIGFLTFYAILIIASVVLTLIF